jgi:hypothetical protein
VTALAVVLVAGAEVAATLSTTRSHGRRETRDKPVRIRAVLAPYRGEPHIAREPTVPSAPHEAAIKFVRDYALWSAGSLTVIPAGDATPRVIRLLERQEPAAARAWAIASAL